MKFLSYEKVNSFEIVNDGGYPVVSFEILEDKKLVEVLEQCDNHYSARLNINDMKLLIKKLNDMVDKLNN